jgi:hypothetical protein
LYCSFTKSDYGTTISYHGNEDGLMIDAGVDTNGNLSAYGKTKIEQDFSQNYGVSFQILNGQKIDHISLHNGLIHISFASNWEARINHGDYSDFVVFNKYGNIEKWSEILLKDDMISEYYIRNSDGSLYQWEEYTYDEQGRVTGHTTFNSDGTVDFSVTYS